MTLRLHLASDGRLLRPPAEAKPGPDYQRRKLQLGSARKSCNASADVLEPIFGMNLGKYVHADRQKPAAKNFVRPQILQLWNWRQASALTRLIIALQSETLWKKLA